jgi:hypothetical protein
MSYRKAKPDVALRRCRPVRVGDLAATTAES